MKRNDAERIAGLTRTGLRRAGHPLGMLLAQAFDLGSIISFGSKDPNSTQRYFLVLATHDVADRLRAWTMEQSTTIAEASDRAGYHHVTDKDIDEVMP